MCTVSFVCSGDKTIITSNRDEEVLRPAIPPKNYRVNGKNLVFPKDPRAGGTWFAVGDKATVLVLLNGAAEKHLWNPPYRKSRGLVLLDLIASDSAIASWDAIDLDGIEPFTLVLFEAQQLFQLRWYGKQKDRVSLDTGKNYIWSSTTLYPKDVREQRAAWFDHFLETRSDVNETEMLHFHRYTESGDSRNGLVINRNDKLRTLSITQAVIEKNKVKMRYDDLLSEQQSAHSFLII